LNKRAFHKQEDRDEEIERETVHGENEREGERRTERVRGRE
jgi:hypothetical protein